MSHEYIIKKEEKDPLDTVITKKNISVDFTMREVYADKLRMEKMIKEFEGQLTLSSAKIANIEEHHPFVKEMSEQDLFTAHMYQEQQAIARVMRSKLEELKQGIIDDAAEQAEIFKQIGIAVPIAALEDKAPENKPNEETPKQD